MRVFLVHRVNMAGHSWTDSELVEILNKSGDNSSVSSISSDSRDKEIDDVAVADAIINGESDEEEEIRKPFLWETMDSYLGHKELFRSLVVK